MKFYQPASFKVTILFFVFYLSALFAQAQQKTEEDKQFEYDYDREIHTLSLYGENNLFLQSNTSAYNFGARLDINSEVFGLYYKLGAGVNSEGKIYGHVPLGLGVGTVIASYTLSYNNYGLILPAIVCALVPEGVTFRFWKRNNYDMKIYVAPLGAELNMFKESPILLSGEFGLQANVINKHKYNLSCYVGGKAIYKHFQPAATVGATIGFLLE
jgi:hypothetical protein